MNRTIAQNAADLEIAKMRMDQARDRLADAIIAGDHASEPRLEMTHAAAIQDYYDLKQEPMTFSWIATITHEPTTSTQTQGRHANDTAIFHR